MDNDLKLMEHFEPIRYKIDFTTNNTAKVLLRNHSMLEGAIYSILAQADPLYSYKHHKTTKVRPWSYSLLKFHKKPTKINNTGFSKVEKNSRGFFFLKSIDNRINQILKTFAESGKILNLGKLELIIDQISIEHCDIYNTPPNIDTVVIKLETPTFFYNNKTKENDPFCAETFLNYQCEKFKQLEIMNIESESLYPYLWILKDFTKESSGYITNSKDNNSSIQFDGRVGKLVFKVVGNGIEREIIWKILYLSEFTGIGTRTSMGFGHNSLVSVTSGKIVLK